MLTSEEAAELNTIFHVGDAFVPHQVEGNSLETMVGSIPTDGTPSWPDWDCETHELSVKVEAPDFVPNFEGGPSNHLLLVLTKLHGG